MPGVPLWRARIAGLLGDADGALALLRQVDQHHYFIEVHSDPAFAALRGRAEFRRLAHPDH